jgi:hypothetical protein
MKLHFAYGLLLALLSQTAFAKTIMPGLPAGGAESGGGGNAVACRDEAGHLISAVLQDLFEAGQLPPYLNIVRSDTPYMDQFNAMIQRVNDAERNPIRPDLTRWMGLGVVGQLHILDPGVGLGPVDDQNPVIVEKGCKLERLAFFDDRFYVLNLDRELWGALGETDRAALLAHESLYYDLRTLAGETTSDRTRYVVGWIASDSALTNVYSGVSADADPYYCDGWHIDSTTGIHFTNHFVFTMDGVPTNGDPTTVDYTMHFSVFDDLPLISPTTFQFTTDDLSQTDHRSITILGGNTGNVFGPSNIIGLDIPGNNAGEVRFDMNVTDGFFPHQELRIDVQCMRYSQIGQNMPGPIPVPIPSPAAM